MPLTIALLFIAALFNMTLGLFVYLQDRKNLIHVSYGLAVLNAAMWSIGLAMFSLADHFLSALFWATVYYVAAAFIAYFFLHFSFVFPYTTFRPSIGKSALLMLPVIVIIVLLQATNLHIEGIMQETWGKNILLGPAYYFYSFYFVVFMTWAFVNLVRKYLASTDLARTQAREVIIGTLIATVFGATFNLFFPLFGNYQYIWLGPYFTVVMVAMIGYAILRHRLWNIKVIATQVLIAVILLVLATEVFLSRSSGETALRSLFLLLVAFFCILLMRSVLNEVRQREQLERLTKELEAANKELKRLDQAKSEFLSIASHQLRTPLTAIKGYASMLQDGSFGTLNDQLRQGVEKVYESTERMIVLVNDLLDTTRMESGRMQFTFTFIDLAPLVQSVCDEMRMKAQTKNLAVQCTIGEGAPKVSVDHMKIRQVVMNLIDNAIKYSDHGAVEVRLEKRGMELVFSVKDQGWGMTDDEMEFLFKKFSRGRGERSHIKGSGLGLYVCRRLVEAHGGRVWAESDGKGKGSIFAFALPIGWQPPKDGTVVYEAG